MIDDCDREKYIERSILVNMTLLRKTASEKAQTGAILRVIRALLGIKGTYQREELQKPFAVPTVTFSPDYSDATVRQAMLQQGMNSMGNMFGTASAPPAINSPEGNSCTVSSRSGEILIRFITSPLPSGTSCKVAGSYLYETDRHGHPIMGNILFVGEEWGSDGIDFCGIEDSVFENLKYLLRNSRQLLDIVDCHNDLFTASVGPEPANVEHITGNQR